MKLSEAKQLLEAGHTCAEIAKLAGVKPNEIREALGINGDLVKRLYNEGYSRSDIKQLTGSSHGWADRQLASMDVKAVDRRRTINWDYVAALYREGKNDCAIAREIDCSSTTIQRWRKKQGLPRNANRGGGRL